MADYDAYTGWTFVGVVKGAVNEREALDAAELELEVDGIKVGLNVRERPPGQVFTPRAKIFIVEL